MKKEKEEGKRQNGKGRRQTVEGIFKQEQCRIQKE